MQIWALLAKKNDFDLSSAILYFNQDGENSQIKNDFIIAKNSLKLFKTSIIIFIH